MNKKLSETFNKYKYPLIVVIIGIALLLIPQGSKNSSTSASDDEAKLAEILQSSEGVGNAKVILSERGAVIVCDGADNPQVKLNVVKSATAYTGLDYNEIQVLKTKLN